jgi:hypothetical protein
MMTIMRMRSAILTIAYCIAAVNAQELSKAQEPHNRPSETAQVDR